MVCGLLNFIDIIYQMANCVFIQINLNEANDIAIANTNSHNETCATFASE